MTAPSWQTPDVDELEVVRIVIRHREEVAQATERACRALRAAGVDDPGEVILRPWRPPVLGPDDRSDELR